MHKRTKLDDYDYGVSDFCHSLCTYIKVFYAGVLTIGEAADMLIDLSLYRLEQYESNDTEHSKEYNAGLRCGFDKAVAYIRKTVDGTPDISVIDFQEKLEKEIQNGTL